MSTVAVIAVAPASFIPILAANGMMALAMGASALANLSREKASNDIISANVLKQIEDVRERVRDVGDSKLSESLLLDIDRAVDKLFAAKSDYSRIRAVADTLRDMSTKMNKAKIEKFQRVQRAESVRKMIKEIKAMGPFFSTEDFYRKKLEKIERDMAYIGKVPAEGHMIEMRRMMHELRDIKKIRNDLFFQKEHNVIPPQAQQKNKIREEEKFPVIIEIRDLAERITDLDETEGEKLTLMLRNLMSTFARFPSSLHSLKRQLRATLSAINERIASTSYFREALSVMRGELDKASRAINSDEAAELAARCDAICGGRYIERDDFMTLYEDIALFAAENGERIVGSLIEAHLRDEMKRMGYKLTQDEMSDPDKEPERVLCFETPFDGYRVAAKLDGFSLFTSLLRDPDDDRGNNSGDQDSHDRKAGEKWRGDFGKFLARTKKAGLPLDVTLHRQPG